MRSAKLKESEDQATVYTVEIVSAVSHLHQNGIVRRDLKPENILMDADGHVMLTDFGLAKEIDESSRSNSMCGTTEYMAPEILLSKAYDAFSFTHNDRGYKFNYFLAPGEVLCEVETKWNVWKKDT